MYKILNGFLISLFSCILASLPVFFSGCNKKDFEWEKIKEMEGHIDLINSYKLSMVEYIYRYPTDTNRIQLILENLLELGAFDEVLESSGFLSQKLPDGKFYLKARAMAFFNQSNYLDSRFWYEKALSHDPGNENLKKEMKSLIEIMVIDSTISGWNEKIKSDPKNTSNYIDRAQCFMKIGKFKSAEVDLNKALQINPDLSDAKWLRMQCRIQNDKFKDALADLHSLLEFSPDEYGRLENFISPLEQLDAIFKQLEKDKKNSKLYFTAGKLFSTIHFYDKAHEILERAKNNAIEEVMVLQAEMLVYYQEGQYLQANLILDQLIERKVAVNQRLVEMIRQKNLPASK